MPAEPVADTGKVSGLAVRNTSRNRSLVSSRRAMKSGSRWPRTGRPKALMTCGYGFPGPGPMRMRSACDMAVILNEVPLLVGNFFPVEKISR